ncbi:MAG: ABC transporter ATP-binding protein, partial [Planctomycetales bacterium]|nr:ABC transporter ATP-binding protein [Planctomycetales bacterium]
LLQLWESRPRTIVFVTHNIAEAIYLSHRLIVLGKGRVAKTIDNELAWPRRANIRSSLEFAALYGRVSSALAEVSD